MAIIKAEDLINSVADALQYISYYHPKDFVDAMYEAYNREESKPAKDAMAQILINSRMSATGKRPICQDTGMVCAFVKVGMDVKLDDTSRTITELVNEGVKRGYADEHNPLRASMVFPPHGARKNTKDNTPAIVHIDLVHGNKVDIDIAAKGGGSEFKSKFKVLNPSDSIADWVEEMLPTMGAGWCPPGIIGIGVGGTSEKAMILAKESLSSKIDMQDIIRNGPQNETEELRLEIFNRVNALGIGAQGLGGLTTVLDVKINEYPTHAACKPVALIPNCAATRHIHFTLDGSGEVNLPSPKIEDWPIIKEDDKSHVKKINLDTATKEEIQALNSGDNILLSGKILTGRDAAHKRLKDMYDAGEEFPVNLKGKFIYYVGPVDPVGDEVVGPAGPTTATRMDKFTPFMLENVGVMGMIGKSERGQATIDSIKKNKAIYLMGVGGAAYLISKSIKQAKVVGFEDLGMEAIYEFEVEDMPVTVAVDSKGVSAHQQGPKLWKAKIAEIKKV